MRRMTLVATVVAFGLLTAACTIDIEANPDGSLTVESVIDEQKLQEAIQTQIEDPSTEKLDVNFHDGYIAIDGTGPDEDTGEINDVTFEATLGVSSEGFLTVDIYDATWNGEPMPEWIVEFWNNALARELEKEGKKDPDSTLKSVEVTDTSVTMVWHVETDASRG